MAGTFCIQQIEVCNCLPPSCIFGEPGYNRRYELDFFSRFRRYSLQVKELVLEFSGES